MHIMTLLMIRESHFVDVTDIYDIINDVIIMHYILFPRQF